MIEDFRQSLPLGLAQIVADYVWRQIHVGLSSAWVFRLEARDVNSLYKKTFYLKIDSRASGSSLLHEKLKLDWLQNRLPVPEVVLFTENKNVEYLLLSEIPGVDASAGTYKGGERETIEQLASGLKMIHNLPTENCPFSARLSDKISLAEERIKKVWLTKTISIKKDSAEPPPICFAN